MNDLTPLEAAVAALVEAYVDQVGSEFAATITPDVLTDALRSRLSVHLQPAAPSVAETPAG